MNNERIYYSHDGEMHAMRERAILTIVFLMSGLAIGIAVALIFAPSSGKVTRHELAKGVEDRLHTGRESVEPLVKRLEEQFSDLRKHIEQRLKND